MSDDPNLDRKFAALQAIASATGAPAAMHLQARDKLARGHEEHWQAMERIAWDAELGDELLDALTYCGFGAAWAGTIPGDGSVGEWRRAIGRDISTVSRCAVIAWLLVGGDRTAPWRNRLAAWLVRGAQRLLHGGGRQ